MAAFSLDLRSQRTEEVFDISGPGEAYFGSLDSLPVQIADSQWTDNLDTLQEWTVHTSLGVAILDSGASHIFCPPEHIQDYLEKFPEDTIEVDEAQNPNVYYILCAESDEIPDFVVGVGRQSITIPGRAMLFLNDRSEDNSCQLRLLQYDKAILGQPFMEAAMFVFDISPTSTKRVGISPRPLS